MRRLTCLAVAFGLVFSFGCGDDDSLRRPQAPLPDITAANLNILHGLNCPAATRLCRFSDRFGLLFQHIEAAGCPDVVTLQEVASPGVARLNDLRATTCPFPYEAAYLPTGLRVDDQMVLSRYAILEAEVQLLYRGFRSATWARIDHPTGMLDVFTTHLASSSDNAGDPCAGDCPPECVAAGAQTVRQCQGVQLADYVAARHDVPGPALVTGDFNESPDSFVYRHLIARGWLDTYLEAGNPECVAATGSGCTSGREDSDLSELESPASNQDRRIDYIFLAPGDGGGCDAVIDAAGDGDHDGRVTGPFTAQPNPFVEACGAAPLAPCYPSDHGGTTLDLNCR